MRVVCPMCRAAYRIDADRLPVGKEAVARCRRCGARFPIPPVQGEGALGEPLDPPGRIEPVSRKAPAPAAAVEPHRESAPPETGFGAGEALGFGWMAFKRHTSLLVAATATFYIVQAAPQVLGDRVADGLPWAAWLIYLVGMLASQFVALGLLAVCLKVCDGRITEYREIFACRERFLPFLAASVLYGLLCTLGLLLFVIPGVYWGVTHAFYGFAVLEGGAQGALEALKRSAALTQGRKWLLLRLFCLILGISILGALPCGLGLLVTTPVSLVAMAYAFRRLQGVTPRPAW